MTRTLRYHLMHPLTKDRLLRSLMRYAFWHVATRMSNERRATPLGPNSKTYVKRGTNGAAGNYFYRLHEFHEMAFFLKALRAEDLFIDVGANIGNYSLLASKDVGAQSIAIEPIPSTLRLLRDNIALNKIEHLVTTKNVGVGSEMENLKMTTSRGAMNQIVPDDQDIQVEDIIEIEVYPLDRLIDPSDKLIFIKMDTEGFEEEVLKGANRLLSGKNCVVVQMEVNEQSGQFNMTRDGAFQLLRELGFTPYLYDALKGVLLPYQVGASLNVLFIKDKVLVQKRLNEGPDFTLRGINF